MLLFDIGPVYIRCALIIEEEEKINLIKQNKSNLQFFDFNLKDDYFNKKAYFFKINLFKQESFINSYDLKLINDLIISDLISYYCGPLKDNIECLLLSLFKIKLCKLSHTNKLSVIGLEFISDNIKDAFYELPNQPIINIVQVGHSINEVNQKIYCSQDKLFPLLFANILEGLSIYKAESPDNIERLGGTSFGSSTYWSLVSLICGYDDPEKAVKDAIKGNNTLIDLSVGDIYGGSYDQFSLNSSLIASSFGKIKYVDNIEDISKGDISRSLLTLFSVTNAQITALHAKNAGIDKIIILGNPFESLEFFQMVQMTTYYYSEGTVKSYFTDYSPYINLIGMINLISI